MNGLPRATPALVLAMALGAHCGEPQTMPDGGDADATTPDVTMRPRCEMTFTLEPGSATGHAQPLGASAGEARAGRIQASDLPADPHGLLLWAGGDFVLANNRIALVIEDVGQSDLYDPWGGKPVGLARVAGGRLVEPADFNETIFGIGRHTIETTSVSVLRDGSDGGPAVVRAIGMLKPIPFIDEFGRPLAPAEYSDIRVAMDYELAPDADHVDMHMTFDVTRPAPVPVNTVVHAFFQHYRMPRFTPGNGFGPIMGESPFIGFVDDGGTSYAWMSPDSALTSLVSMSGFDGFTSASFRLPACAQTRRHVARMIAGGPGLDGLLQSVARVQNERRREIRGTVVDAGGAPAAGVRVHATSADGARYFTRATTDAAGAFVLHVPEGEAAQLSTWRAGDAVAGPVSVAADAGTAMLRLAPAGAIRVVATQVGAPGPLPVRVQVIPVGAEAPSVPPTFGEVIPGHGRVHIAYPTDGVATLRVPAGRYRVLVSRGYEYEIHQVEVNVPANETVAVAAVLRRSVDTPGVLCGDFHIHTHRSPDASDTVRLKLASAVGDGLEIPVRSDHEFVADFEPMVQEMGLGAFARGVPSLELTTFAWGHFGVFPLTPDPSRPNQGAFFWPFRLPRDVFAEARARPSNPTIIINHPRSGGRYGGFFEAADYDPATGMARRPDHWDEQFTAVEVFNDSDFESNRSGTVRDWFSLLNHGRRVFAVGSSDSHTINPSAPVGYPRTCMYLGTDNPRDTDSTAVRDAAAQGRSYISGGIYVTAEASGGVGPGQQARGVGPRTNVRVRVQAPTWIGADSLEVIVDGMTTQTITLNATTTDPTNPVVRFNRDVEVPVAEGGSWVVFAVHAMRDLAPVHPGKRAFGVTNPIFLQR